MQVYLIITLLVFGFGPVEYNIRSPILFWSLMILYKISLIIGYLFGCSNYLKLKNKQATVSINSQSSLKWFYIILSIATLNVILSFGDFVLNFSDTPSLIEKILDVFDKPGENYAERTSVADEAVSNKVYNFFRFYIIFSQTFIIPLIVFNWARLGFITKTFSVIISFIPMFDSISSGVNKGLFDFIILYSTSIVIYRIYINQNKSKKISNKSIYILPIMLLSLFLLFFGHGMSQRGGDLRYIESTDNLNNIRVNNQSVLLANENFAYYTYAWLSTYVVQGYYGFSLALEEEFDSTYGVGHSVILTRNIESILNIDLKSRTFQRKITSYWDENGQWHSFYSYLANDLNFPGVALALFVISFLLAKVWISFLDTGNVFAGVIVCIFAILVIFIPANNQIFSFLHGLSAFFWGFVFWVYSIKKSKI